MKHPYNLNLLIIDDNQLYAEDLVGLLEKTYYKRVNLGFLDAKDELIKLLRQSWDVLIMGKAYDLSLSNVVDILKQQEIDLPVIAIIPEDGLDSNQSLNANEIKQMEFVEEEDKTEPLLPLLTYWGAVDALPKDRLMEMVLRIYQEHHQLIIRRRLENLRHVLTDAEQRANILIKNSKSAVSYIEQGLHIYANDPYLEMFGFNSMEELLGMPVVDLIAANNIKDFKQFLKDFERGHRNNVEFKFESIRSDGSTFAAKLQLAAATYEGQPCLQVIIQPNEQGNNAELVKKLAEMERIDQLTGFYNRRGFEETLTQVRQDVMQQRHTGGLLYVRLDNVGKINSSVGIQGIDSVVVSIGQYLQQQLSKLLQIELPAGYISRFSDVTFMLIIPNIEQAKLEAWAKQLIQNVADSIVEVGNRSLKTSITIGATMLNSSSPEVSVLMDRVIEAANIVRKNTNDEGNDFALFDPTSLANEDEDALLEALQVALEQSKFELLYQPIYDVEQDSSNFFEVFLRLPLANGETMKPDKFAELADKHGLMGKIDRWMLIQSCKALKQYRETEPNAHILVHLSAKSLVDETLPAFATQLLRAIGGNAQNALTIQFNEATIIDYLAMAAKQSENLKQVGCQVGIYNFGAAVNAMEILDFVKPNMVRLDRSYVKDLGNSDNVETIKSLIAQSNEYGCESLMAFVEDPAAMSAGWTVGARYLQGDYLQPPTDVMQIQSS